MDTVEGSAVERAESLSDAIDLATSADECKRPCRSQAVAQLALDGDDVIQLRRVRGSFEPDIPSPLDDGSLPHVLHVLHRRSGQWSVWGYPVQIGTGCGAGKCVDETIARIEVARIANTAWFRVRVVSETSFGGDLPSRVRRYDIVVACKLGTVVSCAQMRGDAYVGSTSTIRGSQVLTRTHEPSPRYTITTFDL
jgi:hypothetical protein